MALVLGIDPSAKKIAVVAIDTVLKVQIVHSYVLYKTGKQTNESIGRAYAVMMGMVQTLAPMQRLGESYAYIEAGLSYGHGGNRVASSIKQAYVSGVVRGTLVHAGYTVRDVQQATWKKAICNNGHADKADVARVVKVAWPKVWSLVEHDRDLIDAAAIAQYGIQELQAVSSG